MAARAPGRSRSTLLAGGPPAAASRQTARTQIAMARMESSIRDARLHSKSIGAPWRDGILAPDGWSAPIHATEGPDHGLRGDVAPRRAAGGLLHHPLRDRVDVAKLAARRARLRLERLRLPRRPPRAARG